MDVDVYVDLCFGLELDVDVDEDMDVNAGAMLTQNQSVSEKGEEIYQLLLDVASGKQSKSEALGLGDYEFVPWQIGATM